MLLLSDIDHAEESTRTVRAKLNVIAREILIIRKGKPVEKHWRFDGYSRRNYTGEFHDEQDNPDWGRGTPIMIVCFYWSYNGGGDHIYVTFPQSWLGQDWGALEQERVDAQRRDEEEQERIDELQRAGDLEAAERATLERLKQKYETQ